MSPSRPSSRQGHPKNVVTVSDWEVDLVSHRCHQIGERLEHSRDLVGGSASLATDRRARPDQQVGGAGEEIELASFDVGLDEPVWPLRFSSSVYRHRRDNVFAGAAVCTGVS